MFHFRHRSTFFLLIVAFIIVVAGLFFAYKSFPRQTTLPANANLSVIGAELDQSKDYVDLHQLESNGLSFVYLRATQGKSYFDEDYNLYRDQIQGTRMAFGTVIYFSDQSTVASQWNFFQKKVGANSGSLPILLKPAQGVRKNSRFYRQMGQMATRFLTTNKMVMVLVPKKYQMYFPSETRFLNDEQHVPNKNLYAFWQYTNHGHVKNTKNMEDNVTMYAYNGTMGQYKQLYGELTQ